MTHMSLYYRERNMSFFEVEVLEAEEDDKRILPIEPLASGIDTIANRS